MSEKCQNVANRSTDMALLKELGVLRWDIPATDVSPRWGWGYMWADRSTDVALLKELGVLRWDIPATDISPLRGLLASEGHSATDVSPRWGWGYMQAICYRHGAPKGAGGASLGHSCYRHITPTGFIGVGGTFCYRRSAPLGLSFTITPDNPVVYPIIGIIHVKPL